MRLLLSEDLQSNIILLSREMVSIRHAPVPRSDSFSTNNFQEHLRLLTVLKESLLVPEHA